MNKVTTIQVSIETHDKLYKLKKQFEDIFEKSVSYDQVIDALILAKVNLAEELI